MSLLWESPVVVGGWWPPSLAEGEEVSESSSTGAGAGAVTVDGSVIGLPRNFFADLGGG